MADLLRFKDVLEMDGQDNPLDRPELSFNDLHVTQYRPGEDELINYRAMRRKKAYGVGTGEGGYVGESTQKEGLFDRVGDKVAKAKRAIANGMPRHVAMAKYLVTSKDLGESVSPAQQAAIAISKKEKKEESKIDEYVGRGALKKGAMKNTKPKSDNSAGKRSQADAEKKRRKRVMGLFDEVDVDEALTMQQRLKRARIFKRLQPRIKIAREKAKRRIASKEKLQKRTMKKAREAIFKKLTKKIPKSELTYARRQEIEKRLDKPAMKKIIQRLARKLYPKVRKAEVEKKRSSK